MNSGFAVLSLLPWLALGALLALLHLRALHWNVRLLTRPGRLVPKLALVVLRLAVLGAILLAVARLAGAVPLLLTAGAFLLVRTLAVRRLTRQPS